MGGRAYFYCVHWNSFVAGCTTRAWRSLPVGKIARKMLENDRALFVLALALAFPPEALSPAPSRLRPCGSGMRTNEGPPISHAGSFA
ncbi:hypothetical protein MRX96_036433 [Rhipicephalus microplus]